MEWNLYQNIMCDIYSIKPFGQNCSEIYNQNIFFSFKMSLQNAKWLPFCSGLNPSNVKTILTSPMIHWCAILIAHQIVMANHGGSCVHFSGISTCGRTSRETVSHSQRQPFPTPHKIALPVYVTVTNKRLQPLTTTLCNSLVLSFSLLTTKRRLIKHRSFLCVLRCSQLCRRC